MLPAGPYCDGEFLQALREAVESVLLNVLSDAHGSHSAQDFIIPGPYGMNSIARRTVKRGAPALAEPDGLGACRRGHEAFVCLNSVFATLP